MARDRFARARALVLGGLLAGAALGAAGCSSGTAKPPFPADPDPCAAYCLKWVPPVYRDVPRVTMTKAPCVRSYEVCTHETRARSVCVPGECKTITVPDVCRETAIVQVKPPRWEWRQVECEDCYGCEVECCWRRVRVPPEYDVCPKCETEEGFTYCVTTPPQRDVVFEQVPCTQSRCEYVPAEYGVCYDKECWTPGHWVWEKRDCAPPPPECPKCVCAPCPSEQGPYCDPCRNTPIRSMAKPSTAKPTWGRCPPAD
jgi:hypothetical protein